MQKIKAITIFCFFTTSVFGQPNDSLFSRLRAISNNGVDFYNVDGIVITSQKKDVEFSSKNISTKFRQLSIKEKDLNSADTTLGFKNFYVYKSKEKPKGIFNNTSFYFIESSDQKLMGITFNSKNKTDKELERTIVRLIKNDAIPKSIFTPLEIDSIDFAGRKIYLGKRCNWMAINNVQCPYNGQMDWSIHKSLDDASQALNNRFTSIKASKGGKIISDTTVTVIFEGTEIKSRRIVYDFTGIKSLLVGMSGGKTLTVYYVAAPVRNNFVSCIMSFWNNDRINPGGLPPLLEQVMKLK